MMPQIRTVKLGLSKIPETACTFFFLAPFLSREFKMFKDSQKDLFNKNILSQLFPNSELLTFHDFLREQISKCSPSNTKR